MFGRVAMPYAAHEETRAFVRKSMANVWAANKGKGDVTCPHIPNRVREYYARLSSFPAMEHYPAEKQVKVTRREDADRRPTTLSSTAGKGG